LGFGQLPSPPFCSDSIDKHGPNLLQALSGFSASALLPCKLAYPRFIASYTVSVRQYRILPFDFLHGIPHGKPACHLLILPGVTPAYKGFSPYGKITHLLFPPFVKFICIFELFQQLTTTVSINLKK